MKKTNITDTKGGTRLDSTCVIWTGPDIPCLDICAGDKLDDAVFALADIVCSSVSGVDLATLSIQCLITKLAMTAPLEKNVLNILQVLVDSSCKLKDLVDTVNTRIDGLDTNGELNLTLGCLATIDGFGAPIFLTQLELDQVLIDAVCSLRTRMTTAEGRITTNTTDITNLTTVVNALDVDPIITTCIGSAKPVSEAVVEVAANLCAYKSYVGTIAQITTALAMVYPDLDTEFQNEPGWIKPVTSEAQSISNLWIAFSNYANRIKVIEQTCCAPTCDKIKLGVIPTFDFQANTVSLLFSSGAGTKIPSGFTDAGTEITFIDENGLEIGPYSTLTTPITIDAEIPDLYLGMLAAGILTISFKTKFVLRDRVTNAVILTCADCMSIQVPYDSGCCVYTNTGSDTITIIYSTII